MDDIMEKIGGILSDEESMKQLSELAKMIMSGELNEDENPSEDNSNVNSSANSGNIPDLGAVMKLSGLAGAFSRKDPNTQLLEALKPHLSEERRLRVDKAVKLLRLLAVWNIAKESGLLNDLL